ncbi:11414_t:CDS:2 [Dentiscutata heterogama]|uniref:11414_t:CDS:1 n=1 Tax=Dentiscutata heterogama TaxID=1316150 RepID=A0ACA9N5W2_9GLOM|nr:11414_t:CDS:2 [Dentiscutata heterogama]
MDAVGREFALKDDNLKITNTKHYCANHLRDCPYFATKYSPEQIQLILNSATLLPPNKQVMISYTDEEDEDENNSTSGITSSNSLASSNTLKKQTTLSKYVGRLLTASEISKFELVAMSQLYAEILRAYKKKIKPNYSQSDYSSSALSSSAALVSASSSLSNQDLEFEETNTDDINKEITSEIDWNFEEEQDDLDIADIDFLDSEMHPAENQATK